MSLLDEFQRFPERKPRTLSKKVLFRLMEDLITRKEFSQVWATMDPVVKNSLLQKNLEFTTEELRGCKPRDAWPPKMRYPKPVTHKRVNWRKALDEN